MNDFWNASLRKPKERIAYKKQIGKGSYGEVWLAEWKDCEGKEREVAAKRIHQEFFKAEYDQDIRDHFIADLRKEWETLRKLEHPSIVKIYTMKFNPPVILMELMHSDLQQYIKESTSNPKVSPEKVLSIALGVSKGLEYLHGLPNPIVHRDLASKNILLTEDGQPKIADLGLARVFEAAQDDFATALQGTPSYAAPETRKEVRDHKAKYGAKADIFSFGVVLLEMSVGHDPCVLPLKGKFSEIRRRQKDIDEMEDGKLKKLVIKCLKEKSSSRPSASKLVTKLQKIIDQRERERPEQGATFERVSQTPNYDNFFKVLLLGNSNVGKSSLFELSRNPVFDIDKVKMKATHSIEASPRHFEYNGKVVRMDIVDTAGEERWFSLTSSYYRDVDGVFLVYDVSNKESLQSLPFWIANLKKYNRKDDFQMILVGNKVDLRKSDTTDPDDLVPEERAIEYANNIKAPYVETSARWVDSATAMYEKMVEILMSTVSPEDVNAQVQTEEGRTTIRLPSSSNQSNSGRKVCCL